MDICMRVPWTARRSNQSIPKEINPEYLLEGPLLKLEGPCVTPIPSLKKNGAQFSCSVMSGSLRPHGLQHARPPCPSPAPGVYSNSCPLSQLMPSSHLILWRPLLLLPSIFPSIMVWKDPDSPSDKAAPFPALWFTMISRRKYHSCATVSWTPLKCF